MQTVPVVCMHCEQPTCAEVCPADAIKRTGDGVVQSARKPRCIACGNCVMACPFGVPELYVDRADHDEVRHVLRPHVGRQEADVRDGLPEPGAVLRHARADRLALRPQSMPTNRFRFGEQTITTRVNVMVPRTAQAAPLVDVTAAMDETAAQRAVRLPVSPSDAPILRRGGGVTMTDDPQSRDERGRARSTRASIRRRAKG